MIWNRFSINAAGNRELAAERLQQGLLDMKGLIDAFLRDTLRSVNG